MADRRSDSALVAAAQAGDQAAFGELVGRYLDAVFGVAYHRLGDFEEARDAAQEAFIKAYTKLSALRSGGRFSNWLYRIADRTAISAARRRQEVPLPLLEVQTAKSSAAADQSEIGRQVREALATLTEPTRLAVILHYVNGYSHAEVARFLGVSSGAVKTRLCRARSQLRKEMVGMVEEKLKQERPLFLHYLARDVQGNTYEHTTSSSEADLRQWEKQRGTEILSVRPATEQEVREIERAHTVRLASEKNPIPPWERSPAQRVALIILTDGVKRKASVIKVLGEDQEKVKVRYVIGGVECDAHEMPSYMWQALREEFAKMAGLSLETRGATGQIRFEFQDKEHVLMMTLGEDEIRIER